jgi:hypothetical protein
LRAEHSGKCLTAYGYENGGLTYQWTCGAGNNIEVIPVPGGWNVIKFLHSGKCLTVHGWQSWDNGTLDQWDCNEQANQLWNGSFIDGAFEVHGSKAYPNKCVTVAGEAWWDGALVNQYECRNQANQLWMSPDSGVCHASYQGGADARRGGCIEGGIGDYDCWNGGRPTGNGPNYAAGPLRVVGPDDFDLDSDHDGVGCENG